MLLRIINTLSRASVGVPQMGLLCYPWSMEPIPVPNPWGAPVYFEDVLSSTMDTARALALRGEPHGTVITAGFQEQGRGRVRGRSWKMNRDENLAFTVLLRYGAIPRALTLRAGLALALGIEEFAPALRGAVMVKWPNDIMIAAPRPGARKAAGILTEGDGSLVYIGIGVNLGQKEFPPELGAVSLALALEEVRGGPPGPPPALLGVILTHLHRELEGAPPWRERLESRLFKKGEKVRFIEGPAGSGRAVEGVLAGIGPEGELLITPPGKKPRPFVTGELEI
jgi:BirA family biotin operon repressor/biotin-[acetyl-CoA-carboxylase] ligase